LLRGEMTMFGTYVAGLSYAGATLRTVVLHVRKSGPVLCYLSEAKVDDLTGAWFLRPLIDPKIRLLRKVSAVSVGVDNASVFYHSFPADPGISREERDEMIEWELSHFIADYAAADFIRDIHNLAPETGATGPGLLVVAANRSFVQNIQSLLRDRKLGLQVIETNFFGATYALGVNYPETAMKRVLVAAIESDRVDAGILGRGKLERHICRRTSGQDDLLAFLAGAAAAGRVDEVYLSGAGASHAMAMAARRRFGVPVEMLNPVRKLRIKRRYERDTEFAGVEYRFASAIGCALRRQ
jgi:Tfp pilus assembly PilM family ATPase